MGFPGSSDGKASVCNVEDPDLIPGLGISPGEGNGNPLQYSCLENPKGRGAWWAAVHGVAKSRTRLGDFPFTLDPHAPWKDQHHLVKKRPFVYFCLHWASLPQAGFLELWRVGSSLRCLLLLRGAGFSVWGVGL